VAISPPQTRDTADNFMWGLAGSATKSAEAIAACAAEKIPFVSLGAVYEVRLG
jgi:hypothetical protein